MENDILTEVLQIKAFAMPSDSIVQFKLLKWLYEEYLNRLKFSDLRSAK